MNRAEKAAIEAIPKKDTTSVFTYFGVFDIDYDAERRKCYEKGYAKGEKDTIERANEILSDLISHEAIGGVRFMEAFNKAMEGTND